MKLSSLSRTDKILTLAISIVSVVIVAVLAIFFSLVSQGLIQDDQNELVSAMKNVETQDPQVIEISRAQRLDVLTKLSNVPNEALDTEAVETPSTTLQALRQ